MSEGQSCLLRVKVTCLRFCSLAFIRQSEICARQRTTCAVAWRGHLERLRVAMSSANVDIVSCLDVGISAVYSSIGPSTLP